MQTPRALKCPGGGRLPLLLRCRGLSFRIYWLSFGLSPSTLNDLHPTIEKIRVWVISAAQIGFVVSFMKSTLVPAAFMLNLI